MEIAKVIAARVVRLFDIEELNPQGKNLLPMLDGIRERYKFLQGPDDLPSKLLDESGIKFLDGSFNVDDRDLAVHLSIYNDGLVASTKSNTSDTDLFLDDLFSWATTTYGIGNQNYILKPKQLYRSELLVFSPSTKLCDLSEKIKKVASAIKPHPEEPVELVSLTLGGEHQNNRILFSFERRGGIPFDEHKYYTSAAMQTDEHLRVLSVLEELFSQ